VALVATLGTPMSGVLRWEDPPEADRRGNRSVPAVADWYRIAAQLCARPGDWAAIAVGAATSTPTIIREGRYAAFRPPGAFDAVGRRVNGTYTVYARYIGKPS
jgi:hypothetical protein